MHKDSRLFSPRTGLFMLLMLVGLATSGCTFATIVSLDEAEAANAGFNAVDYVDGIWESEVKPAYETNAVDIITLLEAIRANEAAAIETYGRRSGTGGYSLMVRGTGQLLEIDTSSGAGLAHLDLVPYDGDTDVSMAIGPVVRGNALRDAVGFIDFNEFANQMDFAAVYREMNNRIKDEVLANFDFEAMEPGSIWTFVGAFTLEGDSIVVAPIQLEVQG
jgi:predicted lipoprotein